MDDKTERYGELNFYQGQRNYFMSTEKQGDGSFQDQLNTLKSKIRELLNLKNVNFLFGSGTSCGAIPTMAKLFENLKFSDAEENLKKEFDKITAKVGENLESCLGIMYSARAYYNGLGTDENSEQEQIDAKIKLYNSLIQKIERHIFNSINIDFKEDAHRKVLEYYQTFYQKLALRTKDNSRIRIFTTNNDLFNEHALDSLNIHYINGFSGGLHRFFNPAVFNYTYSKRMDTSIDKYEPVENMVYLYKIHGSVNWRESETHANNYFEIEEVSMSETNHEGAVLIYPTPTKYELSLSNLYVDLFREFQNKLLEPHSVLFVIGYSFSDKHVNDVIYRALATNSTLNIVIFGEKPTITKVSKEDQNNADSIDKANDVKRNKPIFFADDNRIFTIWGVEYKDVNREITDDVNREIKAVINHFEFIVSELLPNLDAFRADDAILEKFLNTIKAQNENR
jgi:hypothetical protein